MQIPAPDPMSQENLLYQYRWLNPSGEPQPQSMLGWEPLLPRPGQTMEGRVEEVLSYESDGKPQYAVRVLYASAREHLMALSPEERLEAMEPFCPECGNEHPQVGSCQCWNDE